MEWLSDAEDVDTHLGLSADCALVGRAKWLAEELWPFIDPLA